MQDLEAERRHQRGPGRRPLWLGAAWAVLCLLGALGVARFLPVSTLWVAIVGGWVWLVGGLLLMLGFCGLPREHCRVVMGRRLRRLADVLERAERPSGLASEKPGGAPADATRPRGGVAHRRMLQQCVRERDRAREEAELLMRYLRQVRRELEALEGWSPEVEAGAERRLADVLALLRQFDGPDGPRELARTDGEPPRVLIVDDGPVNAALARRVLGAEGLQVDITADGEAALALMQQHDYALVFMDIFMPTLDGVETSRRWRALERERRAVPSILIALTANASEADRQRFFAAGMDDYLAKPYRPQALVDRVHRWLPGRLLRDPGAP
ncbi:response regulator [Modicisalibacter sp. 'Wilcox']|uniref:response regulator n=1 Tax=Modicisalibacter sp. 'Wilcox' TaxID=2679914 RepID=UPI0013D6A208|nr:response regulator [Modicisalibacter sp. 'Wilcox']